MIVNGWTLPADETHFINCAEQGQYQPQMLGLALSYVTDHRTAVDIGAHVGFHARRLTDVFDDVWAFEPVPSNYECLVKNAPKAKAIRVALGNERGDLTLSCPAPGNSGSWERGEGIAVPLMKLDDYPIANVGFVKIDVQGMELEVLKGAEQTIRRDRPVVVVEIVMRGETNSEVVPLLQSWGARHYDIVGKDIVASWR